MKVFLPIRFLKACTILTFCLLQACSAQHQAARHQKCCAPRHPEQKWLFYDLDKPVPYQGYTSTDKTTDHEKMIASLAKEEPAKPAQQHERPIVNEDDILHLIFTGSEITANSKPSCTFTETPYTQASDSKIVSSPIQKMDKTALRNQLQNLLQEAKQVEAQRRLAAKDLRQAAKQKREALDKAAMFEQQRSGPDAERARELAEKAEENIQEAQYRLDLANSMLKDLKLRIAEVQKEITIALGPRLTVACHYDAREKGGIQVLSKLSATGSKGQPISLDDTTLVHNLYRYRIIAGPVFSTLQKKNKTYSLQTNTSLQKEVTASDASTSPANFVLMLKTYIVKRDVLDPPSLYSSRWCETITPVIGINLFDKPLQNFYAGLAVEPLPGLDVIGGAHWAKTQQLADGFAQGQVTTADKVATKDRFNNGWFVGVAADIGVVTTWLEKIGAGVAAKFQNL